jgi:hypothetical protein
VDNTIIVKIILSKSIHLSNYFFAAFRNQYTDMELEVTANGKTSSFVFTNISRSMSDVVSKWMDDNHNKLPFHNELSATANQKKMICVISGGYG